MIRALLISLSCLLIGCSSRLSNEEKLSYQLIENYSKELKKKDNFDLIGTGMGGNGNGKIATMGMYFDVNKALDINDARKLFLAMVQNFISKVNSDSKYSFIENYPININSVRFKIRFVDKQHHPLSSKCVGLVFNVGDQIIYKVWDDWMANPEYKVVFHETYDQALVALKEGTSYQDYLSNPR